MLREPEAFAQRVEKLALAADAMQIDGAELELGRLCGGLDRIRSSGPLVYARIGRHREIGKLHRRILRNVW
jgi:hypothetical protein